MGIWKKVKVFQLSSVRLCFLKPRTKATTSKQHSVHKCLHFYLCELFIDCCVLVCALAKSVEFLFVFVQLC